MTTILATAVERVPCDSLTYFPRNPRQHDIPAIAESLRVNSQYRPLVVQKSTRHVLAGNGTLEAAVSLGWTEIYVLWIDCDDLTAKRIVLADNRLSDIAGYSADDLAALLVNVEDLTGTGYSTDDLARLSGDLPEGFQPIGPGRTRPRAAHGHLPAVQLRICARS